MDASQPASPPIDLPNGVLSAISNEMVRIYKDQFGRGPTKTRTQWAGPDIVVVTLEQTLTPAERKLVELGELARLRELRLLFQYAEVATFCAPVERLTGRKVRAFISGLDAKADLPRRCSCCIRRGTTDPPGRNRSILLSSRTVANLLSRFAYTAFTVTETVKNEGN